MQCYDIVEVIAITDNRFADEPRFYQRNPRVGDRGVILECYTSPEIAYEVECFDTSGCTVWLEAMYPAELSLVTPAKSSSIVKPPVALRRWSFVGGRWSVVGGRWSNKNTALKNEHS